MKHVIRGLVAALLTTAAGTFVPSPASAHTEVCVGQGAMTTTSQYYPVFGPNNTGSFAFGLPGASSVCVSATATPGGTLGAGGTLGGWCGQSIGVGTANGHRFNFVSAGSMWVLYAQPLVTPLGPGDGSLVVGLANVVPDVTTTPPQNCASGATLFLFTGVVAMIL